LKSITFLSKELEHSEIEKEKLKFIKKNKTESIKKLKSSIKKVNLEKKGRR